MRIRTTFGFCGILLGFAVLATMTRNSLTSACVGATIRDHAQKFADAGDSPQAMAGIEAGRRDHRDETCSPRLFRRLLGTAARRGGDPRLFQGACRRSCAKGDNVMRRALTRRELYQVTCRLRIEGSDNQNKTRSGRQKELLGWEPRNGTIRRTIGRWPVRRS
jgi:hypothetical protein